MKEEKILKRISEEVSLAAGESTRKLLEGELDTKQELRSAISQYDEGIAQTANSKVDIDVNLAHSISQACLDLLDNNWDSANELERRLIQLACCYYIEEDDDENGDFDSVFGFDDDATVLNIVLENIGREDLTVLV